MLKYITRRLLIALPTLFIISVVVFLFGLQLTKDPVMENGGQSFTAATNDPEAEAVFMAQQAERLHVNLPPFYVGVHLNCLPDTLYKVYPQWRQNTMRTQALQCGAWQPVAEWHGAMAALIRAWEALPDSLRKTNVATSFSRLKTATDTAKITFFLKEIATGLPPDARTQGLLQELNNKLPGIVPRDGYGYPVLTWYGVPNQYHNWLTGKYSTELGSPWKKMAYPLRVTLFINVVALVLGFVLGIPLGLFLGTSPRWDRWTKRPLMVLYIIPLLLLGCILRYLFATSGHGFYSTYIGGTGTSLYNPEQASFGRWLVINQGRLLLPILTTTLHTMALIALQMRSSVLKVARQDYIRTAYAKGLPRYRIVQKHIFANALFPIIVLFGAMIPSIIGGAIGTELIFGINGLGYTSYDAILNKDYDVMMTIVLLVAVLTITGSLLADILLAWVDPRVKSEK